jgi:hypothetical protein
MSTDSQQQYEGQQASHAVSLLCKMFVEKTMKDQQELVAAANAAEPVRPQEGWQLNIERGIWVRPLAAAPAEQAPPPPAEPKATVQSTEFPKEVQ